MAGYRMGVFLVCALLGHAAALSADEAPVPKHLQLGRLLLAELAPENNSYEHKDWVRWKGDFGVSRYEAHTDCSGLINGLLERAQSPVLKRLKGEAKRGRPRAENYYDLIARQDGFTRIASLTEVLPGDIIAVKYLPGHRPTLDPSTGHVMLVDAKPLPRKKATKPIVEGTKQWEVTVIDSSQGPHGKGDTRQREDGSKRDGTGRGVLRLYADEQDRLLGYSFSTVAASKFYDSSSRPVVIGRPIP